jgi:hypothetical protein
MLRFSLVQNVWFRQEFILEPFSARGLVLGTELGLGLQYRLWLEWGDPI